MLSLLEYVGDSSVFNRPFFHLFLGRIAAFSHLQLKTKKILLKTTALLGQSFGVDFKRERHFKAIRLRGAASSFHSLFSVSFCLNPPNTHHPFVSHNLLSKDKNKVTSCRCVVVCSYSGGGSSKEKTPPAPCVSTIPPFIPPSIPPFLSRPPACPLPLQVSASILHSLTFVNTTVPPAKSLLNTLTGTLPGGEALPVHSCPQGALASSAT